MATFTATADQSAAVVLNVNGVGAAFAKITNTTTGVQIYNGSYNNSSMQINDTSGRIHVSNSYSCAFSTTLNGSPIGTLTASATPEVFSPGSINVSDAGGGWVTVTWTWPGTLNSSITRDSTNLWVGGSATNYVPTQTGVTIYVGYSQTILYQMTYYYTSSYSAGIYTAQSNPQQSFTTPPAPPAAPNPATNGIVTADNQSSSVSISWTASVGGATGYYIYRSINGAGYTYLNSTSGTTFTDSASGSVRPITYEILAYNSNAGGTTTASSYAYAITLAPVSTAKAIRWNDNTYLSVVRGLLWTVFNLRLVANGIAVATNIVGGLTDIDEDPNTPDASWATGTGAFEVRLPLQNPGDAGMQTPTGRQRFRVIVRTP